MTGDHRTMIDELLDYEPDGDREPLSDWEDKFVGSVNAWNGNLTGKQATTLEKIWSKCFG